MDDLISRQAAIDALNGEINITGRANAEAVRGYVRLVKDRLERLPSAQPKERTEERAETHACDLIDRQAAIDAVNNLTYPSSLVDVKRILVDLPSAQPEIIRCKECLWRIGRDCTRFTDLPVYMDDYCGRAKRRGEQDETD